MVRKLCQVGACADRSEIVKSDASSLGSDQYGLYAGFGRDSRSREQKCREESKESRMKCTCMQLYVYILHVGILVDTEDAGR